MYKTQNHAQNSKGTSQKPEEEELRSNWAGMNDLLETPLAETNATLTIKKVNLQGV